MGGARGVDKEWCIGGAGKQEKEETGKPWMRLRTRSGVKEEGLEEQEEPLPLYP